MLLHYLLSTYFSILSYILYAILNSLFMNDDVILWPGPQQRVTGRAETPRLAPAQYSNYDIKLGNNPIISQEPPFQWPPNDHQVSVFTFWDKFPQDHHHHIVSLEEHNKILKEWNYLHYSFSWYNHGASEFPVSFFTLFAVLLKDEVVTFGVGALFPVLLLLVHF